MNEWINVIGQLIFGVALITGVYTQNYLVALISGVVYLILNILNQVNQFE